MYVPLSARVGEFEGPEQRVYGQHLRTRTYARERKKCETHNQFDDKCGNFASAPHIPYVSWGRSSQPKLRSTEEGGTILNEKKPDVDLKKSKHRIHGTQRVGNLQAPPIHHIRAGAGVADKNSAAPRRAAALRSNFSSNTRTDRSQRIHEQHTPFLHSPWRRDLCLLRPQSPVCQPPTQCVTSLFRREDLVSHHS